jgi:hypothetical protein
MYHPPALVAMLVLLAGGFSVVLLFSLLRDLPSATEQFLHGMERLRQLPASRVDESICQFARSFEIRRTDTWVLRAVYEELQEHLCWVSPAFPVRADDSIDDDLLIDRDDLDLEIVWRIAERARRSLEHPEQNPFYAKVATVRDLVSFFLHQPRVGTA